MTTNKDQLNSAFCGQDLNHNLKSRREVTFKASIKMISTLRRAIYGGLSRVELAKNPTLYPLRVKNSRGEDLDLGERFAGKLLLIVNTASKCGFTKQYDALEAIYQRYKEQGLEVLAFPSNDFMQQEPGSDAEIESFCRVNFGVSFEVFPKVSVRGEEIQPVFKALTQSGPADLRGAVRWNFEKFLIDRQGRLIARWRPWVNPAWSPVQRVIRDALVG
jgi:glutathione peroxidase